ncbi:ComEC/Rec2 family competence protein [Alteromonas portus]|uniref:ComEC/Rec2 family competence protein n=1 Tax=Alteromonas portus TaxID=2565549 RepID=UPI003BF7A2D0
MALMIAILLTSLAIILLFSITKIKENNALPEVLLCWTVSGLLTGVLWVASVGHFYYAWQLPQGKIQQDVTISGRVLSGGCVSEEANTSDTTYKYVVAIESVNGTSTSTFLDNEILPPFFKRVLTRTFNYKARLTHKHYEFANSRNTQGSVNNNTVYSEQETLGVQPQSGSASKVKLSCLHTGDRFTALVKLKPAYGKANPVGANRQQQLVSQFIHATGYIKSIEHNKTKHNHSVRYGLATTLQQLGLIHEKWWRALLLGDKTSFTLDDWTLLQRTGTGHIFSISGMHLSLIAGVCLLMSNPIIFLSTHFTNLFSNAKLWIVGSRPIGYLKIPKKRREPRVGKKVKVTAPIRATVLCTLIVACCCYALLSGSALPVVRAFILVAMGCVLSLSRNAWRPVNIGLTMVSLSLILFPLSMLSASFYLSVGAVVCIWFLIGVWQLQRAPWYVSIFKLQIALTLIMMPLTLVWFGSASIIAIFANLIALPVITLLLPICLVSLLLTHFVKLAFVQQVSGMLLHFSDACLGYLLSLLNVLSEFSISALNFYLSSSAALCLVGAFLVFLLPIWRYKSLCTMLLLVPLLATIQKWLPVNESMWALHVLDAGQASAIAVTKGNRAIVIDSGAQFNGVAHTATNHLLPLLESQHISNIDVVIHTHSDNDHAGGAATIKQHPLAAQATFYSPTAGCERGKLLRWQNLTIHFLWPLKGNDQDNNAMSCVVKIASDSGSVLIPGDIEKASEYALITKEISESYAPLKVPTLNSSAAFSLETSLNVSKLAADILIAPHHGSKTSSTNVFIEHVAPKAVIFTQGFENRWQFPAPVVAQRYQRFEITQYLTSYHGYIKATFEKDAFYIESQRKTLHKRWYLPGIAPRHLNNEGYMLQTNACDETKILANTFK